jgi:tRNA uridine 5-carbamoylmethylation protein Kti12
MTFKKLTESIEDKGILKAVFMMAGPGSGKTFIGKQLMGDIEPRLINTDKFSRDYFGIKKEMWDIFTTETPKSIIDKSKLMTQEQLALNINSMLPLLIDSTSSNTTSLFKRDGILKSLGYETAMVFIKTSLEVAQRRNKERLEKGDGGVPEEFLIETYKKISDIEEFYRDNFKNFFVIQNEDDNAFDMYLNKRFKEIQKFYSTPSKNPIGVDILRILKEHKGKYISDVEEFNMERVQTIIKGWY